MDVQMRLAGGSVCTVLNYGYYLNGRRQADMEVYHFMNPGDALPFVSRATMAGGKERLRPPTSYRTHQEALNAIIKEVEMAILKTGRQVDERGKHSYDQGMVELIRSLNPGPEAVGDPFWVILNVDSDGNLTGEYYIEEVSGRPTIPMYISQEQAEQSIKPQDRQHLAVRGLCNDHYAKILAYWDTADGMPRVSVDTAQAADTSKTAVIVPPTRGHFDKLFSELLKMNEIRIKM